MAVVGATFAGFFRNCSAMVFFTLILLPAVLIYGIHIFIISQSSFLSIVFGFCGLFSVQPLHIFGLESAAQLLNLLVFITSVSQSSEIFSIYWT